MEGKAKETLLEMQLLNYIGKSCFECGHTYDSIEDINKRNPRVGSLPKRQGESESEILLVCSGCWEKFAGSER